MFGMQLQHYIVDVFNKMQTKLKLMLVWQQSTSTDGFSPIIYLLN